MTVVKPSKFSLIPARVGLKAVAVFRGRNLQAVTAILKIINSRFYYYDEIFFISYRRCVYYV